MKRLLAVLLILGLSACAANKRDAAVVDGSGSTSVQAGEGGNTGAPVGGVESEGGALGSEQVATIGTLPDSNGAVSDTLYFETDSDQLSPESRALLAEWKAIPMNAVHVNIIWL
jgi:hypothetical protein